MSMVGAVVDVCAGSACNDSGGGSGNCGSIDCSSGGVGGTEERRAEKIEATTTQCIFVANIPNQLDLHNIEKCLNEQFKDSGEIVFIKASMDKLGRPYGFIYFKEEIPFAPLLENEFKMCGRRLRIEKAKGSAATASTFPFNTTTTTTTPKNIPLFPCYLVNVDIERWTPCRLLKLFSFYGDIQFLEGPKRFGPNPLDTLAIIYYTSQEEALQAAESINGSLMDTTTVHSSTNVVSLTANEFYYNNDVTQ